MNDPYWFLRDNADELCDACSHPLHAPSHKQVHRGWMELQVAQFRRELGIEAPGPHVHVEPRRAGRPLDPGALVRRAMDAEGIAVEKACELALQGGTCGVRVSREIRDGKFVATAAVDPTVPYGEIYDDGWQP